jgi:hypothetical protein
MHAQSTGGRGKGGRVQKGRGNMTGCQEAGGRAGYRRLWKGRQGARDRGKIAGGKGGGR